ncbi:MAG: terminase small subunit, partial [Acetobacteraceae bacterium]
MEAVLQAKETQKKRTVRFSPALAEEICRRIAEGASLTQTCAADGMPDRNTVFRWVLEDVQGLAAQFNRACEVRAHFWVEEILDLADGANSENWNAARLQVDTRKWLAAKFYP